ncbi:unnamed protein product [Acanthoscelides obtectus]|uniref:Uncharacterized protein n=1 Tax=Acanthoscelides obtectus TaxID=200917 RepID=A0A9P0P661_ACAOB|nr:unnamed protein product [Acanthoscelides obtectus]CAK1667434.1 hypothetical protein AOBTE_LOCUS25840 [Acanthoscelides obtectus]
MYGTSLTWRRCGDVAKMEAWPQTTAPYVATGYSGAVASLPSYCTHVSCTSLTQSPVSRHFGRSLGIVVDS